MLNQLDVDDHADAAESQGRETVLLRVVDEPWPFPPHYPLSKAALEVLSIVAYRQPITRAGIEFIRGSASDSALDSLLHRKLVGHNQHHRLGTTHAFLDYVGLRDLADLPPLPGGDE